MKIGITVMAVLEYESGKPAGQEKLDEVRGIFHRVFEGEQLPSIGCRVHGAEIQVTNIDAAREAGHI